MSYELTIALKPDLSKEGANKVINKVEQVVEGAGGKVEKVDSLGIKTLSYPIKGLTQASFARFRLDLPPAGVPGLQTELSREEGLLRVLIIKGGETAR